MTSIPVVSKEYACTASLRLISYRGVAAPGALALDRQGVTLDVICPLSPVPVPEDTCSALQQCRIEAVAAPTGTHWWLRNLACNLHCTVNTARIDVGEGLRLQDGDVIELGLMQMGFGQTDPCVASADPSPNDRAFQLADLNQLAPSGSSLPPSQSLAQNPFADIHSVTVSETASEEVMATLHRQYLRLMQNPNDPQMAASWEAPTLRGSSQLTRPQAGAANPLSDPAIRQTESSDIYDILGHSAAIDPILTQLDTLSDFNLLQASPPVDVLRLFAPVQNQTVEPGLPSLTRRDHHDITADSAMPKSHS